MRTTLTLDDDVAGLLKKSMEGSDLSFKEAVNQALKRGLLAQPQKSPPPVFRTRSMGLRKGVCLDCIPGLMEDLDRSTEES